MSASVSMRLWTGLASGPTKTQIDGTTFSWCSDDSYQVGTGGTNPLVVPNPLITTTIAAGSNGAALPQGTINLAASTAALTTPGFAAILIGGTYQIVSYSAGNGSSQLIGAALGTGTLATGQTVLVGANYSFWKQIRLSADSPPAGTINNLRAYFDGTWK